MREQEHRNLEALGGEGFPVYVAPGIPDTTKGNLGASTITYTIPGVPDHNYSQKLF